VVAALPAVNGCFAAGSGLLLVDAAYGQWATPMFACIAEAVGAAFFCVAAGFGGYARSAGLVRFGMCCWLVGSLLYAVRPWEEWRSIRGPKVVAPAAGAIAISKTEHSSCA
jgi:hypothetical protein